MAASDSSSSPEVFPWLKTLPLAPEYHPSPAEFQDPISYIFKIEKDASKFGICKIVPPVSPPPKKTILANLNKSLEARNNVGGASSSDRTFTSRQQQIGFCPRRGQPVQRPVWQSGERYTYAEFEAKAKAFERGFLRTSTKRSSGSSALEIETMYWKATLDKPFTVEYANDMPGSAFPPIDSNAGPPAGCSSDNLAETAWNMRAVSRAKGSLLRFMKEEIPGVTSPMVYVAMLFSWFAWHVEDHDLHSLNYLHSGASKTWYGVPRDAAVAFEEVVRVQGYNGEINPLVTFSKLGEKTTVMSPEVFVRAGVPCCRLVQNAGEFVVTFPRAYHTGFSHGFNCAEAANIATPEWLSLAKDAAIRRASINYPPMVSHFQLLYDLALELCSRIPLSISAEPRSSRLKDKKKGEGETIVKESFAHSVLRNNSLLRDLGKGSPIVLLPKRSSYSSVCSKYCSGLQSRFNFTPPLASCSSRGEMNSSRSLISDDLMIDRNLKDSKVKGFYSMKGKLASLCEGSWVASLHKNRTPSGLNPNSSNMSGEAENTEEKDGLSDHRLFSCVTCGILSFACVAIIKPREQAARYLMSADCSFFNDWDANPGVASNVSIISNGDPMRSKKNSIGGWADNQTSQDIPVASTNYEVQMQEKTKESLIKGATNKSSSALRLLALNYGDISDSDEDLVQEDCTIDDQEPSTTNHPSERNGQSETSSPSLQNGDFCTGNECSNQNINNSSLQNFGLSDDLGSTNSSQLKVSRRCSPDTYDAEATKFCNTVPPKKNENMPLVSICDDDSSRMHVFCLEHAVEIEERFRKIGGVHIQLLCHPEYPKIVAEAKVIAEELGLDHLWNEITFRDTTKEDEDLIQLALDSEEAMHKNGDWAVKLGINLFYSANLSRSPLYSKQMPYNSVIYSAFGRSSPASLITGLDSCKKSSSRQRKFMVGRWCGRVWMSHQAHPLLVQRDLEDDEEDEGDGEKVMGFSNWEPDVKPLRKSDVARKNLATKKYLRKRKIKPKCVKKEDCEVSDISLDEGSRLVRRSLRSKKKAKHAEKEDSAGSDDSMEQGKSLVRSKKAVVSEDSLVGFGRVNKQILGNKRGKQRSEDLGSDDSLDLDSHRVRVTVPKNFRAKQLEHEDSVSDDPADGDENDCHRSCRRISKSSLAKFMEREDSGSDDFCCYNNNNNNSVGKRLRNTLKSKQAKSVPDEPVLSSKSNRRSKLTKSTVQVTPRQSKQETRKMSSSEEEEEEDLDVEPYTGLKKRSLKPQQKSTRPKLTSKKKSENIETGYEEGGEHVCDVEGCAMSFGTKQDLALHKRNICPVKGCGKKFFSHKYLVQHRRVHVDDRPLRCPWKGCKMSFKWAWARTEHIRVHTGARPYICAEPGCSQTFRFVSDFSRHKRKTGHSVKKGRK